MGDQRASHKTCTPCRTKKIRCDGNTPICGPCSRGRAAVTCVFPEVPRRPAPPGSLLQKGAACLPCRLKKKKCDAKRPFCTLCESVGKADECEYSDSQRSRTQELLERITELENMVSSSRSPQMQDTGLELQRSVSPLSGTPGTPEFIFDPSFLGQEFGSKFGVDNIDMASFLSSPDFSNSSLPDSPLFANIFRLSPELPLQGTVPDLRSIRNCCLFHRVQLGFDLSIRKLSALRNGDLSNTIIHPILVSLAHAWGVVSSPDDLIPYLVEVENAGADAVMRFLADENNVRRDPTLAVMVATQFGSYQIVKRQGFGAIHYFQQGAAIINNYRLRAVPSPALLRNSSHGGAVPSATLSTVPGDESLQLSSMTPHIETWMLDADDAQEHNSVLYTFFGYEYQRRLDISTHFQLDAETSEQLEKALPYVQGMPSIRTRAIQTLVRARELIRLYERISKGYMEVGDHTITTSDEWFTSYWELLNDTTNTLQTIRHALTRCAFYGKNMLVITLRSCIVLANTTFMELHGLMFKLHADSRRAALNAADEVIDIILAVKDDDYYFLDPFLVHCWLSISDVLHEIERFTTPTDNLRGSSFAERHEQLGKFQRSLLRKFQFLRYGSAALARKKYRLLDDCPDP